MLRWTRELKSIAVVCGILLGTNTAALAQWDMQDHVSNHTGQVAYDLAKVLEGRWTITNAIHGFPFTTHNVIYWTWQGGTYTIIHWSGGQVPSPGEAYACFNTLEPGCPRILATLWTKDGGWIIGPAGVTLRVCGERAQGNVQINVENTWRRWIGNRIPPDDPNDGPGEPFGVVRGKVYYAMTGRQARTLEELNADFVAKTPWKQLDDLELNYGETKSYNLGDINPQEVVVFRIETDATGGVSGEMIQMRGQDVIPATSQWGLLVLTAALLAGGALVIVRRRRTAAAA
jgi:hypothetical protein